MNVRVWVSCRGGGGGEEIEGKRRGEGRSEKNGGREEKEEKKRGNERDKDSVRENIKRGREKR